MTKSMSVLVLAVALTVAACGSEPPEPVFVTIEPSPTGVAEPAPSPITSPIAAPAITTPGNVFEMVGVTAEATDTAPDSTDSSGNPVSYNVENVLDGDPGTSWRVSCETEYGECWNADAYILITFDEPVVISRVGLIPGYDKVDPASGVDWFKENRKIERLTWTMSDGSMWDQEFEPERTMQTIPVAGTVTWIRIGGMYVHNRWEENDRNFIVISDIEVTGMPAPEAP